MFYWHLKRTNAPGLSGVSCSLSIPIVKYIHPPVLDVISAPTLEIEASKLNLLPTVHLTLWLFQNFIFIFKHLHIATGNRKSNFHVFNVMIFRFCHKVLTCFPSVACTSFMTPSNGQITRCPLNLFLIR